MRQVTLEMDGLTVNAAEGQTLLEAARSAGLSIPTLCTSEGVKPCGACRLCMVEIQRGQRTKLVASCVYLAEPGLVVRTTTPRIRRMRRLLIELLWPTAQHLAKEHDVEGTRFPMEHQDCNLCGLCVRYCAEVKRENVVYFKGRGIDRRLAITPGREGECIGCQECFKLCPGGWIVTQAGELRH